MKNAIKIIDDLMASIREPNIPGELMTRITVLKRENDIVEDVGSYERGQTVHFNPDAKSVTLIRAKVMRCYGTAKGKVFYDLALSFVDGQGVETFAETSPICKVSPAYVRGISPDDQSRAATREIQYLNISNANSNETSTSVKNVVEGEASDTTFSLPG